MRLRELRQTLGRDRNGNSFIGTYGTGNAALKVDHLCHSLYTSCNRCTSAFLKTKGRTHNASVLRSWRKLIVMVVHGYRILTDKSQWQQN